MRGVGGVGANKYILVPAASVLCKRWRAIGAGVVRGVGGVGVELSVVLSMICMFT